MVLVYPVAFWNPVSQGSNSDPYFNNVVLLSHFDGSNGSMVFIDSSANTKTITTYNGASLTSTSPKFGTTCSNFVAASNQYAEIPASVDFEFGTGLFTIDFWIKTTQGSGFQQVIGQFYGGVSDGEFSIRPVNAGGSSGGIGIAIRTASGFIDANSGFNINDGNWHFIRIIRDSGTTLKIGVDGITRLNYTSLSESQIIGKSGLGLRMSRNEWDGNNYFNGQIDDLRITKGVARDITELPTSAFPDSGSSDPFANNVVLFLQGNGTNGSTNIVDSSPTPKTITVNGNAQISTAQSKYGGSSILLNADGDVLTLPPTNNGDFLLGIRDFTIEAWIYPISKISNYPTIICNFTTYENDAWSILWEDLNTSNKPAFIVRNNGDLPRFLPLNITPTYGNWRHIAVCRNGNIFRFFIDGILQDSVTSSISVNSSKDTIRIGKADAPTQFMGYISHIRITMDVGRYTTNFNPETDTYLNI